MVTLYLVVLGELVATTMETMPTEEVATQVTSVETAALLQATMAMVAMEALPLVVSSVLHTLTLIIFKCCSVSLLSYGVCFKLVDQVCSVFLVTSLLLQSVHPGAAALVGLSVFYSRLALRDCLMALSCSMAIMHCLQVTRRWQQLAHQLWWYCR